MTKSSSLASINFIGWPRTNLSNLALIDKEITKEDYLIYRNI
jgi:hypothetical protein